MTVLALVCKRVARGGSDPSASLIPIGYQEPYLADRPEKRQQINKGETVGIQIYIFDPETLSQYLLDPKVFPSQMLKVDNIPEVPNEII
jgi:hypothetical protein